MVMLSGYYITGAYKITNQVDGKVYVGGAYGLDSRICYHAIPDVVE